MYKITEHDLIKREVCKSQLHMFQRMFPNGAVLNRENTRKAFKAGLDLDWVADKFLNSRNYVRYDSSFDESADHFYKYVTKPLKEQKSFFVSKM